MKKVTSIVVVVVALLVVMTGMALASNISATKHNLSSAYSNSWKGDVAEVCIYCHTPHGSNQATAPLWNRTSNVGTIFTNYSSGTVTQTTSGPGGTSLACLSCHDGVTAINTLINKGGAAWGIGSLNKLNGGLSFLGTDLSNDHPVGINADPAVNGDPDTKLPLLSTGIRVFSSKVECASCHDVHDNSKGLFLAAWNTGSAICLACHIK